MSGEFRDVRITEGPGGPEGQLFPSLVRAEFDLLVADRDRYRAALEFYAAPESYENERREMWSRAREALGQS